MHAHSGNGTYAHKKIVLQIWNFSSGECLKELASVSNQEITGIICLSVCYFATLQIHQQQPIASLAALLYHCSINCGLLRCKCTRCIVEYNRLLIAPWQYAVIDGRAIDIAW